MSRQRSTLPPLDAAQRYTVEEAIRYLRSSRASVYKLIGTGRLTPIRQGRRCYISGAEIARLSQAPAAPHASAA
jgi:excisionase family DNA binding protein